MSTISSEHVEQVVIKAILDFGAESDQISRGASFEALDFDSLDLAELAQIVDEEFGVELKSGDLKNIKTVGQAIDLIAERAAA